MSNKSSLASLAFVYLFGLNVWGAPPDRIMLTCRSSEIGRVEIVLSDRAQKTISSDIAQYAISAKHFTQSGHLIGEAKYPLGVHWNTAMANVDMNSGPAPLDPEPIVDVKVPAIGVNWDQNADQCYVRSPAAGFRVSVGLNSQTIPTSYGRHPSVNPYQVNPAVETVIIPGPGFGTAKWVLNGKDCPDVAIWKSAVDFACEVSWH